MHQPQPQHDAIPGFTAIAPSIWELTPLSLEHDDRSEKSSQSPSLIILCSWTGAKGQHVSKYTSQYESLFPNTRILVITTTAKDLCFRSSKRKQKRLLPAIQRIGSYKNHSDILMHVFSEGGSNKAVELAEAYHSVTGSRLPCSALFLDSTPGHARYRRLCKALRKSLPPNTILTVSGTLLGAVVLGGIWCYYYICAGGKKSSVVERTRKRIMDEQFWDLSTPRCYLYSTQDVMISSEDVREHAQSAMSAGVPVMEVLFQESDHCKHALHYPSRYWNAVRSTWKGAQNQQSTHSEKWGLVMLTEI